MDRSQRTDEASPAPEMPCAAEHPATESQKNRKVTMEVGRDRRTGYTKHIWQNKHARAAIGSGGGGCKSKNLTEKKRSTRQHTGCTTGQHQQVRTEAASIAKNKHAPRVRRCQDTQWMGRKRRDGCPDPRLHGVPHFTAVRKPRNRNT